jgi:hypothetical protein
MKKLLPLVCAASLVANAALIILKLRQPTPAVTPAPTAGATAAAAQQAGTGPTKLSQPPPQGSSPSY